ncbi:MAG TPA: polysaccharide biosynthesis tyrosine autokinase [Opitutaceae bacterium]|nr:polysaccharide biosynthesis tyrosine autokinase [Opitutaceae bacterium]
MAETPVKPPSPPSGENGEENAIERRSLRDYYIILRERIWIALPLALLVSIGLGYYQSRETPMYSASATIQFEKPEKVVTTTGVTDTSITSEVDLNTHIQVLRSGNLRAKVMASFTPDEIKILQEPYLQNLAPGAPPPAGIDIGSVSIDPIRNSFLIMITVHHRGAKAAALVANRYVEQFMTRLREQMSGTNEEAVKQLNEAADRLRKESDVKDRALQAYMKEHQLGTSLDATTNTIKTHLLAIDAAHTAAHLEVLQRQNEYGQVEAYQREGKNLYEITAIANHGTIPALRAQLADAQNKQMELADRYLERHPSMIAIANQISALSDQLDKATALAIADLKTSLDKAQDIEKSYEKEYQIYEQQNLRLRDLGTEFDNLKQDAENARKQYQEILDRKSQTTTLKNIEKIPLHPLDSATVPGGPYAPNLNRIVKTCVGIGLLVFVGVAVGLSFIDDRIKSAWDVEHFIGVNLLGIIPDLSGLKDDDKYTLVLNNNQAPGVESFLSVYSAAKIHSKLDFPKSILVTSTIPGEGKTLVSCNLAGSFARHGKRTLLIDCDLRRPMLHRHYKQQNNAGVIQWFESGANLEGDLTTDPSLGIIKLGENLSLLCSGGRSKGPTQILESQTFSQLMQRLKKMYDLVVVDSPPLGAVTDSLLIAECTDEVIYVCRFNRAYRKHIRMYIKALRSGRNEILGVVLNGLSPRRIEYYSNYRYYRSYKKYYGAQT